MIGLRKAIAGLMGTTMLGVIQILSSELSWGTTANLANATT